jgi:hypothetical protein
MGNATRSTFTDVTTYAIHIKRGKRMISEKVIHSDSSNLLKTNLTIRVPSGCHVIKLAIA